MLQYYRKLSLLVTSILGQAEKVWKSRKYEGDSSQNERPQKSQKQRH